MITQTFDLNLIPNSAPVVVHCDQYDEGDGRFIISLYNGNIAYSPSGTAIVQGIKPDRKGFAYSCTLSGNTVTVDLTKQMTAVAGRVRTQIVVTESTGRTGSFAFEIDVQASALPDDSDMSESDYQLIEQAIEETTENAEDSEAWAVGERGGVPVDPTDPTYHNNSKWWAEQSGGGGATALASLTDVLLNSPTDDQVLTYNSTLNKWENADAQGGSSSLDGLDDVTIASATNGQVLTYNSTSQEWENKVVPIPDLDEIGDVSISSPTNSQVLKYNSTSQKWENANESGGGGGSSTLAGLDDVTLSSPTNGQGLLYNSTSQKWENTNIPSGGASDLDDLGDVVITTPSNNQVLTYDSTTQKWKNANAPGGGGDYVGLYGMTEIQSSDGEGTTPISLDTYKSVGNYYCAGKGQLSIQYYSHIGNVNTTTQTIDSVYFLLYVIKVSETRIIQRLMVYGNSWTGTSVRKFERTFKYTSGTWVNEQWRRLLETGTDTTSSTGISLLRSSVDDVRMTTPIRHGSVLQYHGSLSRWVNAPVFQATTLAVDLLNWTTDTTSQSGTTLYKKQISLTSVYVESPSVDIGAGTGYVLPTSAEQESYNLIQYVTCDDTVPCLYLYASEIPTTAFYIKVTGVE